MATYDINSPTLVDRIQALPQELQDLIQDEVFTAVPGPRTVVKNPKATSRINTKTAKVLRFPDSRSLPLVSKNTREKYLRSYFSAAFVLSDSDEVDFALCMDEKWMKLIKEVRVAVADEAAVKESNSHEERAFLAVLFGQDFEAKVTYWQHHEVMNGVE